MPSEPSKPSSCCPGSGDGCDPFAVDRCGFLRAATGAKELWAGGSWVPVAAGPFQDPSVAGEIPRDKKLDPAWVRSLFERGEPQRYRGEALDRIGMPIGGLFAGQMYLSGDGRLWLWDVDNRHALGVMGRGQNGENYVAPLAAASPVRQGFALRARSGDRWVARSLDRAGFPATTFRGEYPIASVRFADPNFPVEATLEALSPFIPLDTANSSYPATVLRYTLANRGAAPVAVEILGYLENPVFLRGADYADHRFRNRVRADARGAFLGCSVVRRESVAGTPRPPVAFADFENGYGEWRAEGAAFGDAPAAGGRGIQKLSGHQGKGLVNSWQDTDATKGRLLSPEFTIERPWINFLLGGGNHPRETCLDLVVDGAVARTATGRNSDAMEWRSWNVSRFLGKRARLVVVDQSSEAWGHVDVDQIEFADVPKETPPHPFDERDDFGTVALQARGAGAYRGTAALPPGASLEAMFEAAAPLGDAALEEEESRPVGVLARALLLAPGEEQTVDFVLAWHFPNLRVAGFEGTPGREYASRFAHAQGVLESIDAQFDYLVSETRRWRDTWYESTLPWWLLDRTFASASTLATSTVLRFRDGRVWGWEGVGCCQGTCTHVWHYAWALGRLFPDVERGLRERVDLGLAFDPKTGAVGHRGEFARDAAVDGQAGTILRAWRDHQMSEDGEYLRRNWERLRLATRWLVAKDRKLEGILSGEQPNTLDAAWYGEIPWLSSLYLAALRAAELMARAAGDEPFAAECRAILDAGARNFPARLWNGEHFVQRLDPAHPEAIGIGEGCHIDQVFGQSWAWQGGLGRLFDEAKCRAALRALYERNFAPDVGPFRAAHKEGRPYALAGDGGLVMCTWPAGKLQEAWKEHWQFGYFNECMSGFEHQAAAHMVWEGMLLEGLAVERAIHDRYDAARRNPYNEIECGDHYARAMSSYGVFVAVCGFVASGPDELLGFAPRLGPERFRAAFTAAGAWGSVAQARDARRQTEEVAVRHGLLRLRHFLFELPAGKEPRRVAVRLGGRELRHGLAFVGPQLSIHLEETALVKRDDTIAVEIEFA